MSTFLIPWFTIAGAAAATVPVIVHLLNRRRFQVVEWAAMDFLREALTKSRRMMELRDLLLLLLRVACLLIFGLALDLSDLKRFSRVAVDPNKPVHAVVLIDNSLSMSYRMPGRAVPDDAKTKAKGTGSDAEGEKQIPILLDEAKAKAKAWMEDLPAGSLISVLPTCGPAAGVNYAAYSRREDAVEALAAIRPVDCAARSGPVIDRAKDACDRTPNASGRRILLVTDQQVANWSAEAEKEHLKQLPCRMEVVQVTPGDIENAWVEDVQLRDGVANAQSPAVFIATIGYQGEKLHKGVQVVLKVDGKQVASEIIDLQPPRQMREVVFNVPKSGSSDGGLKPSLQSRFVTAEVSIANPWDGLPEDDSRAIVVPRADSLPVVFVDSQGSHEDAKKKVFGDTWWLRRWLAPQLGPGPHVLMGGQDRPLVQIRHVTIDQLTPNILADARLVVIGGVSQPSPAEVSLLTQYVEQGGNLILAAGGNFDPGGWTSAAWRDGLGILPAPLAPTARGYAREDRRWATATTAPLTLDLTSLAHHYFRPGGLSDDQLRDALGPPVFFQKFVVAQCDGEAPDRVTERATEYFGVQRKVADIDQKLAVLEGGGGSKKELADLRQEREQLQGEWKKLGAQAEELGPSWLTWTKTAVSPRPSVLGAPAESGRSEAEQLAVEELARRARPQVLARYDNGLPMLVRRQWGQGQVLFLTTSLSPEWTTLHDLPQSAWLMDHIARSVLLETLTAYNVNTETGLVLPVALGERGARFTLLDPDGAPYSLSVDALGGDRYGIGLNHWTRRGIYRVTANVSGTLRVPADGTRSVPDTLLWEVPLAVNGPAEESQLIPAQKSPGGSFVDAAARVDSDSFLQLGGVDLGNNLWKWLIGLLLVFLFVEPLLAIRSTSRPGACRMSLLSSIYPQLAPGQTLADVKFSFAANWMVWAPLLTLFVFLAVVALAAVFYFFFQPTRHHFARVVLFVIRVAVLCLLLLLLAQPILTYTIQSRERPALWLLFDGTDSMNIADDLPGDVRTATNEAVGIEATPLLSPGEEKSSGDGPHPLPLSPGERGASPSPGQRPSRIEYLRALVQKKDKNLLEELGKRFRLQAFLFESTQGVRSLDLGQGPAAVDGNRIAEQLTANGQVTDLGGALTDLAQRNPSSSLAGLVVFSDFNKTTGPDPARAAQLFRAAKTKIYTVGVGATQAVDLTARIVAAPYAKTKEEAPITVVLQPTGLGGQTTRVRLYAEPLGGGSGSRTLIGEKPAHFSEGGPKLADSPQKIEFIYKPEQPGRVQLVAEVDRLPGEVNREKNLAHAEISVLDDYLRLMFVEYEPTWEWRFIKEVFHRDPLVGMKGFRTFLYSSDPQVRQQNELFLASMTPPREEFFKNDLIFLGDMPSGPPTPALSDRFCKLVKEFVGDMGGGLVVICGPRFGPQQLAKTPLADLLPVTVDPTARVRDQDSFTMQLTPQATGYPFMQLGAGSTLPEMQKAWDSMGPLPWYQPAEGIHPAATVLAEHPTATCGAPGAPGHGRKQPLIAIRQYGRGEVVYVAFNETWRLRKGHGEELFRKFWKEVMWRLALNHALGANKRFVVQTDQQRYRVDQTVTLTVAALDAKYNALSEKELPGGKLNGQWLLPGADPQKPGPGVPGAPQPLSLTQSQPGLFVTRFVVTAPGEHRVRVIDPITQKPVEWSFTAFSTSVERQSPIRNVALQQAIADESEGQAIDLKDVDSLLTEIQPALRTETKLQVEPLVHTWYCFLAIAVLLLGEWGLRKGIGLP